MSNVYSYPVINDAKKVIINDIKNKLYSNNINYYTYELVDLIKLNISSYRARNSKAVAYSINSYAILYKGKSWSLNNMFDKDTQPRWMKTSYPLDEENADLVAKMDTFCYFVEDLQNEVYQTNRFLINLFSFDPPLDLLQEILGNHVYNSIKEILYYTAHGQSYKVYTDNALTRKRKLDFEHLHEFLDYNKEALQAIQNRAIKNLIIPGGI